jgi:hypothetical protein
MPTAHKSKSNLIRDVVTIGILGLLGLIVVSLYYQLYSLKTELKAELALAKGSVADEKLMSLNARSVKFSKTNRLLHRSLRA